MSIGEIAALYVAVLIFVLSPGPGVVALIARSLSHGFAPAVWLGIGEILGDMVYLTLIIISLGMLAEIVAPYMIWVRVFGAAYLCYIGYKQFRSPPFEKLPEVKLKTRDIIRTIVTGFLISGTNPKVMIFYLSFLPLFVDLSSLDMPKGLTVFITTFLGLFTGVVIYAAAGKKIRKLLDRPRTAIIINRISGSLMIGVGIVVAFS